MVSPDRKGSLFLLTMVMAMAGCGTSDPGPSHLLDDTEPLPAAVRESFGVMAIAPAAKTPGTYLSLPQNTSTAIGTATDKTWKAIDMDDGAGEIVLGSLISGVGGFLGGLLAGVPESEIRAGVQAINRANQEAPLQPGIQYQVEQRAGRQGPARLVTLSNSAVVQLRSQGATNIDYEVLKGTGIDSVLQIIVFNQRLRAAETINPPMTLEIEVHVLVRRVADGKVVYARALDYRGRKRSFTAWAGQDAKQFRAELNLAQQYFSDAILTLLFPSATGQ